MEIKTKSEQVISSVGTQGKTFTIAANAKAFEVLTSTMYKQVKQSIVRELITNGHDGHVKRGNTDTPFYVHCPTAIEPYFTVRDYGCSMDEDTMMNIYTTFFSSTKNDNNEEVGGFGLGCKVPLAYTDQFSVITYLKGVKTTYFVSKESGAPVLHKMNEEPTTELEGTEVIVPVSEDDCEEFKDEIVRIGELGNFNFTTDFEINKKVLSNTVGMNDAFDVSDGNGDIYIRMGGVPYRCDRNVLRNKFSYYEHDIEKAEWSKEGLAKCSGLEFVNEFKSQIYRRDLMLAKDVLFDVKVGEVDITASREDLQYTDRTFKVLGNLMCEWVLRNCNVLRKQYEKLETTTYTKLSLLQKDFIQMHNTKDYRLSNSSIPSSLAVKTLFGERSISWKADKASFIFMTDEDVEKLFSKDCENPRLYCFSNNKWRRSNNSIYFDDFGHPLPQYNLCITNAPLTKSPYQFTTIKVDGGTEELTKAQKAIQDFLDECAQGVFKFEVFDKDTLPKAQRVKRVKTDEEKEQEKEARSANRIEAEGFLTRFDDEFKKAGCIYMYNENITYDHAQILRALSAYKAELDVPNFSYVFDLASMKKGVMSWVTKLAKYPIVEVNSHYKLNADNRNCADNELLQRYRKKITLLAVAHKIPSEARQLLWTDNPTLNLFQPLLKHGNFLTNTDMLGLKRDAVYESFKKITYNFLDSLGYTAFELIAVRYIKGFSYGVNVAGFLRKWAEQHNKL